MAEEKESDFPLIGSFNESKFQRFNPQRSINLYEVFDKDSKKPTALFPTPGRSFIKTILGGTSPSRLKFVDTIFMYEVIATNVYRIDSGIVATQIGTLATTAGPVAAASNRTQIMFVDGSKGWIYTKGTGTFVQITDVNFPANPVDVAFLDGFFLVCSANSNVIWGSAINDGTTWPNLSFFSVNTKGENAVTMAVCKRQLFIFTQSGCEVWYNSGIGSPLPFKLNTNLLLEYGTSAPKSVVEGYERLFWLSSYADGTNRIMMSQGAQPDRISTWSIEQAIENFNNSSDAVANIYELNGHTFYEISFTQDSQTFCFNMDTGKWHEVEEPKGRAAMQTHAFFNGVHYIGSYLDGGLYELSDLFYDNAGENIRRTRITGHFSDPRYRMISVYRVIIDTLPGDVQDINLPFPQNLPGNLQEPDADPQLFFSVSYNGGKTFDTLKKTSTGKSGVYIHRAVFDRLGSGRDLVFKLEFFNRCIFAILGGSIQYQVSDS